MFENIRWPGWLPWPAAALGFGMGLCDLAMMGWMGIAVGTGGTGVDGVWTDLTVPVMLFYALNFAALGGLIGALMLARQRAADHGATIAAQLQTLQEAQDRMVQAEKLASVGRLAAGMAHEVRNPLAVIRSSAMLLAEDLPEGADDGERAAAFIVEEVDRLDGLIGEILAFSRPVRLDREAVDLDAVVSRAITLAGPHLAGLSVDQGRAPAPVSPVLGDPDLLSRVVLGLLVNAQEASAHAVRVSVGQSEAQAWVEVADDGPGVPDETTPQLFEPFFTTKAQGTGLGLAMGQRIAQAHGGELAYRRGSGVGPSGAGACFRVALPLGAGPGGAQP